MESKPKNCNGFVILSKKNAIYEGKYTLYKWDTIQEGNNDFKWY